MVTTWDWSDSQFHCAHGIISTAAVAFNFFVGTLRQIGSRLMKHALLRIDEAGLPAYLESSNPRNIPLYERHGFEVMGEIQVGSSPVVTPMIRAAR